MTVIDASPLINLGSIGLLHCLEALQQPLRVPASVRGEVLAAGPNGRGVSDFLAAGHLFEPNEDPTVVAEILGALGAGERAAIGLAHQLGEVVVIDELRGRRKAIDLGVPVVGTLGVLLLANEQQLIEHIRPPLLQLVDENPWLSRRLVNQVLARADEPPLPERRRASDE